MTNNNSNCFTTTTLEPVPYHSVQQALFYLYTLTSIFSVNGNLLVLFVYSCGNYQLNILSNKNGPQHQQNQPSNRQYSIAKYLNNLAVSDMLLACTSTPFTYSNIVLGHWTYPSWLCPLAQYSQLVSAFVTSMTLTIIGIERYLVTLHPLHSFSEWIKFHGGKILIFTWICGAAYAAIPIDSTYSSLFRLENVIYVQCVNDDRSTKMRIFITVNFLLTFLLPLTIMSSSYVAIMHRLKRRQNSFNSLTKFQRKAAIVQRAKTIKMMWTVLLLYALCWGPVKLFQLLRHFRVIKFCSKKEFYLLLTSYIACHWLAMANSFVNPIIYSFMSRRFRNNLRRYFNVVKKCLSL